MYIGKTRGPVAVFLLSIVTCGIYYIYWLYTTMNDINHALGREHINPVLFTILSIFVPVVIYYVWYQLDKGLMEASARDGLAYKENFILWLLLSLCGIGFIVAIVQIQSGLNSLWIRRGGMQPPPYAPPPPPVG